ncbi:transcription antitermination factor NusB [Acetobacter fallax]|uniref:Transcription antitermination protein NusB n=1 Tax=Acetobacter fallax TaxID=1737473 RepID=A0ABX0K6J4_9PROT|nr:transcription antitermination factor NusB [Acetobacter fallax]NHO31876.1 transcription antitermination factor NusB [Acetobacter fallax]NHO35361.1 transcription antitermination factor NusB [Acetobacter fallax]
MTHSDERLSPALRPRTAARVAAVQALFQIEQGNDRPELVIVQFVQHRFGVTLAGESFEDGHIPEADVTLFTGLVRRAAAATDRVTTLLTETLPATWPVARLDPVLRALFTVAIAEMESPDAPPVKIIINEYLDVAHGFFSGDEPKLVNGVLDTIAKRLKNPAPAPAREEPAREEPESEEPAAEEKTVVLTEKQPDAGAADDGRG